MKSILKYEKRDGGFLKRGEKVSVEIEGEDATARELYDAVKSLMSGRKEWAVKEDRVRA